MSCACFAGLTVLVAYQKSKTLRASLIY